MPSGGDDDGASDTGGFPFEVDKQTGVVRTRRQLDRETDGGYFRFDVTAGDASGRVVSDRANVVVRVTNVNEHRPTIVFPACDDDDVCQLDVSATSSGDVIVRVVAADADDVTEQVGLAYNSLPTLSGS